MSFSIENLRTYRSGNWVKYESKSWRFSLRIICDQILITSENKVLESLNVNGKLKGIVKEDVLILIISDFGQEIKKIKFQIKESLSKCLEELSTRFPVVTYGSVKSTTSIMRNYRKIDDVIKDVMEGKVQLSPTNTIPTDFKNFVKLCLIDPMFPQLLNEIEKILEKQL